MRRILKLAATVGAAALVTSCGLYSNDKASPGTGGDGKGVTVTYVIPQSQTKLGNFSKVIAAWEQKTGNKVDVQAIGGDQYESVVTTRLQSGTGIDIFRGKFSKFDVVNQLQPIKNTDFMQRINPSLAGAMKYKDTVYGVPVPTGINTMGVFYNTEAFSKVGITTSPKTLDEMDQAMAKLKQGGINPLHFSGAGGDGWTLLQDRNALYFAIGNQSPQTWDQLNKNQTTWPKVPQFTEHYNALGDWVKKGYVNPNVATASSTEAQTAVASGKSAMLIQGDWVVGEMLDIDKQAKLGFFPLPTSTGPAALGISSGDGGAHIAKSSKVAAAAEDLLRFMIEPDQVKLALEATPAVSAFNDVDATDLLPDALKTVTKLVKEGPTTDQGESAYQVSGPETDLQGLYIEMLSGRIDSATFATKWQEAHTKSAKTSGLPGF